MLTAAKDPRKDALDLRKGPVWGSFEQLRQEGATALEEVVDGCVATLTTKTEKYRIVAENDIQQLYGLARDVRRLRDGLDVVLVAAQAAKKHNDEETIQTLVRAAAMLGRTPTLPTRAGHEDFDQSQYEVDDDDDVILDPARLREETRRDEG